MPQSDVKVEFREIEVGAEGVPAEDAKAFLVPVNDAMSGEPVGDEAFSFGLDQAAGFRGDGLSVDKARTKWFLHELAQAAETPLVVPSSVVPC